MTLRQIEELETDYLSVKDVAGCLHLSPQLIRDEADKDPKYLGFNICRCGHAFRIPRLAFIAWMKGENVKEVMRID